VKQECFLVTINASPALKTAVNVWILLFVLSAKTQLKSLKMEFVIRHVQTSLISIKENARTVLTSAENVIQSALSA
jgi:hypothetical protein